MGQRVSQQKALSPEPGEAPTPPRPFSDIGLSEGFSEAAPPEAGPEPVSPVLPHSPLATPLPSS